MSTERVKMVKELLQAIRGPGLGSILMKYFPPGYCSPLGKLAVFTILLGSRALTVGGVYVISEVIFR